MINIPSIFVRRAKTEEDFQKVIDIRWKGYKKYFANRDDVIDEFDSAKNAILFLATDENDEPIGTIRILDRQNGNIELDKYLNVEMLLSDSDLPCAEATRFSVPNNPCSSQIKLALWKAYYKYCNLNEIKTMIIWIRNSARRDYHRLFFENIGIKGNFKHPLLGNLEHQTLTLNVANAPVMYEKNNYELYNFFVLQNHNCISIT
jgi:hypothetical protein